MKAKQFTNIFFLLKLHGKGERELREKGRKGKVLSTHEEVEIRDFTKLSFL